MKNLIIEKSFKYNNKISEKISENTYYAQDLGFWVFSDDHSPLVFSSSSYKPQSKKCDVETGEDKKGE